MRKKDPYFFGYGSLVNRDTHQYGDTHPARLGGWRRIWRHTDLRPVAYLTVVPDPDCEIDGLIAHVPGGDWAALDQREHAYDRVDANAAITHPKPDPIDVAVYTVPHGKHGQPTVEHPVLLSYIDVVVQGYLREFGEAGVARFFNTTAGWTAPILDDRAAPIYPRHQTLSGVERDLVDDHLKTLNVTLIDKA
ncbi:gamma-glutamylcyclotransferase family protein [Shimia aestuarii]|uniref:ChaC-like protein n=1 Tax=Shimia aestuarii TaxID=254406 RepID=A0A1I4HQ13_9RHOB|nr:gamma-glutamylcyclotransferase family protein [Shimia aestuarii]SFL43466.1 ChaC-like protein [Shimia aestuarii]